MITSQSTRVFLLGSRNVLFHWQETNRFAKRRKLIKLDKESNNRNPSAADESCKRARSHAAHMEAEQSSRRHTLNRKLTLMTVTVIGNTRYLINKLK